MKITTIPKQIYFAVLEQGHMGYKYQIILKDRNDIIIEVKMNEKTFKKLKNALRMVN